MRPSGKIVVLNGPSSAGKSTLAKALHERLGRVSAAVSVDQFYRFVHPEAPNRFAALNEALFATAVSFANSGFDVIIDTVFEQPELLAAAERTLEAQPHHFVAVTCPLEVLEAREQARGNRRIGLAREQHDRVLQGATYDLYLDTALLSPDACVERIIGLLEKA